MNVINPKYSFVQFAAGGNPPSCKSSLPVMHDEDLKFQLLVTLSSVSEANEFVAGDQFLYVVKSDSIIQFEEDLQNNLLLDLIYVFGKALVSETSVLLCWQYGIPNVGSLEDETCFRLALKLNDNTFYISNCFFKTSDLKYTAAIEYSCEENAYGFNYCEGCSNKVRLAFHLNRPQVTDEETVYMRSDGSRKVLSSVTSKEYEGVTDFMPFSHHEKLKIALSHDIVDIESQFYTGGIRKNGGYEIEWKEMENEYAPATFKAHATPYDVRNDNCQTCESDFEPCVPAFLGTFTMTAAKVGVPYSLGVPFSGSIPATLSNIVKPAWLNISVGENILFSGTPTTAANSTAVSFTLSNACGSATGNSFVKVNAAECTPVTITGSLPPGKVGESYSAQLTLSGTPPFTLRGVNPGWLSGSISGAKVNLTGAPDTEGNVAVNFTVNNCGSSSVNFSQTINVAPANIHETSLEVENISLDMNLTALRIDGVTPTLNGGLPVPPGDSRQSTDVFAESVTVYVEWTNTIPDQHILVFDSHGNPTCVASGGAGGFYPVTNVDTTGPDSIKIILEDGTC